MEALTAVLAPRWLSVARLLIAGGTLIVLVWQYLEPDAIAGRGVRQLRAWLLGALGVAAFAAWWNFGLFHGQRFVHIHEQYHYYIGAKYFPELGYTRLYECTAVADIESGMAVQVARRWIRNLENNELQGGNTVFGRRDECTSRFTPERWKAFKDDIAWFRRERGPELWRASQTDHGYNAPPTWALLARVLVAHTTANAQTVLRLALIDPILIAAMLCAIWWAFGWQTMCVAVVFWGTNYPARFTWTGGAFLRTDWLLMSVLGLCLMKKGRPALAGAALAYASLLRVFPGFLVVGLGLKVVIGMVRERRLFMTTAQWRFFAAAAGTALVLISLTLVSAPGGRAGGVEAWRAFVANSRKHLDTPLTNNMGVMAVLAYDSATLTTNMTGLGLDTPLDTWSAARRRLMEERRPLQFAILGVLLVGVGWAVRAEEDWVALVLGIGIIPFATQLTSYYYAIFLGFALLYRRSMPSVLALTLLATATIAMPPLFALDDQLYTAFSALLVMCVVAVIVMIGRSGERPLEQTE